MRQIFIPSNLNLKEKLIESGFKHLAATHFIDKCHWLISTLYLNNVIRKQELSNFAPRNAKALRSILTSRYQKAVIDTLKALEIIEVRKKSGRETYIPGQESKCYRIGEIYWESKFIRVSAINPRFDAKIQKRQEKQNKEASRGHPGKQLFLESLKRLDFDVKAAKNYIQGKEFESETSRRFYESCIENFKSGDIYIHSDRYGRVYHNVTNIPKRLRSFLSFQGQELYMVDVSASHPCLFSTLYESDSPEKQKYVDLIREDALYPFLNFELKGMEFHDNGEKSDFKLRFFKEVSYAPNFRKTDLFKEFTNQFPILSKHISQRKLKHQKYFAHEILKKESEIVINRAATKIAQHYAERGIFLLSIHDCFMTTKEFIAPVKEILCAEYAKVIGFEPKVKEESVKKEKNLREVF